MIRLLAAGAVLLATTTMASCGFDAATDRDYTPGVGPNDRTSQVDVLSAVIVSKQRGSGTFIAGLSNGSTSDTISVETLRGADGSDLTVADFDPIELQPGGYVNLAEAGGIGVSGDFTAGDFETVSVGFSNGQTSTLDIPVVLACRVYAGLDDSSPSATESGSPTPSTSGSPTAGTTPSATTPTTPEPSTTTLAPDSGQYDCDRPATDETSNVASAEAGE